MDKFQISRKPHMEIYQRWTLTLKDENYHIGQAGANILGPRYSFQVTVTYLEIECI